MRAGVFLDRDDTLIHCNDVTPDGDLGDPALVRLLPGTLEGCRALKSSGFVLVVVSNQGGVARGRFGLAEVDRCNARVNELLGGLIDLFRYCPYHPAGKVPEFVREHPWRKPQPGMLLDAAAVLGLDLASSWMVGDRVRDCEAGRAAGCRTILILNAATGIVPLSGAAPSGPGEAGGASPAVDFTAPDVTAAAQIILARSGGEGRGRR